MTAAANNKVQPHELPFCCPPPGRESWNRHPRVFLQLSAAQPVASCPYCGARYELALREDGRQKTKGAV